MECAMVGAARTGGRGWHYLAMLGFGAAVLLALGLSAPSGTTATRAAQIASVALTDDDRGAALFAVRDLVPGRAVSRCITVDYAGTVGAGTVRLAAVSLTGPLADQLTVTVQVGTGGSFASCAGFTGTAVYSGPLAGLAAGTGDSVGVDTGWAPAGVGSRTYRITVTLLDSNALQGAASTGTFEWLLIGDGVPAPAQSPTESPTTAPAAPTPDPTGGGVPAPARSPARSPGTEPAAPTPRPGRTTAARAGQPLSTLKRQLTHLVGDTVVVGRRVVTRRGGFPAGSLVALGAFLLVQNRIDRKDPKLALAPLWRESDLPFEPVEPNAGGERPGLPGPAPAGPNLGRRRTDPRPEGGVDGR